MDYTAYSKNGKKVTGEGSACFANVYRKLGDFKLIEVHYRKIKTDGDEPMEQAYTENLQKFLDVISQMGVKLKQEDTIIKTNRYCYEDGLYKTKEIDVPTLKVSLSLKENSVPVTMIALNVLRWPLEGKQAYNLLVNSAAESLSPHQAWNRMIFCAHAFWSTAHNFLPNEYYKSPPGARYLMPFTLEEYESLLKSKATPEFSGEFLKYGKADPKKFQELIYGDYGTVIIDYEKCREAYKALLAAEARRKKKG